MKELEEEFTGRGQVRGFMFTQIKKNEHAYLYKVETDGQVHYEIFYRKENSYYKCISYPSNKAFGIWAWTKKDLTESVDLYDELTVFAQQREVY
jgi:hypothetical protein